MRRLTNTKEVYHYLTKVLRNPPKIVVMIDKATAEIEEGVQALKYETKVVELKTYVRENAENFQVHQFEPLQPGKTIVGGGGSKWNEKDASGGGKKNAPRHFKRLDSWTKLLERSKGKTSMFSKRKPSRDHWLSTGAGKSGVGYDYVTLNNSAGVEIYINSRDQGTNKKIFDTLYEKRNKIEQAFGEKLDWQRLNEKKACRIWKETSKNKGLQNEDDWSSARAKVLTKRLSSG